LCYYLLSCTGRVDSQRSQQEDAAAATTVASGGVRRPAACGGGGGGGVRRRRRSSGLVRHVRINLREDLLSSVLCGQEVHAPKVLFLMTYIMVKYNT
jgi:hypothetical protein